MGCRIPIRQMPSGILFFKGLHPMGCRIPIRQMPSGILFFKGLRPFWQIGICQPIIGLRLFGKSEFANP